MSKFAARNPLRPHLWIAPAALLLALVPPAFAQSPSPVAPAYAYDVVSIRQNNTESGNTDITLDHNRFSATNVTLRQLLEVAYDIREDMISGISGPVESARFDVEAKAISIFTALQEQLGLKLKSTHGPVNTLVIDRVEMPSAN